MPLRFNTKHAAIKYKTRNKSPKNEHHALRRTYELTSRIASTIKCILWEIPQAHART